MVIATINTVYCVQIASGVDIGVIQAAVNIPTQLNPADFGAGGAAAALTAISDSIQRVPSLVAAIDAAGSDPDQVYLTFATGGESSNRVWPTDAEFVEMSNGQSVQPLLEAEFEVSQNVSLFEHDSISADDHLGSITMLASEQGQGEIGKVAKSAVEGSIYYIVYQVD